ncbi:HAD family hydrolase [Pseudonocardia broussonetiae]|uniref:Haloacid dehalogenase-like hydrolase n=1 Tax=Pseudonocardia broussonetiae TaxID=2736640 RepID=A0A6M6JNW5_9PSEU|nr:HAD family hydrolase [Pseudonocardia broussonetiae]QJY47991.1 haloacid dehalogenase-like hydrolase [Pseudonocardia broussonetiae]
MAEEQLLTSWRDAPAKQAIVAFVRRVVGEDGTAAVPVEDRVAVFDNDGTLWCEKPMPIQLDFVIRRLAEMAAATPELRDQQPWKAVSANDLAWFGTLMTDHYAGDDTRVRELLRGILAAYDGISVEEFEQRSNSFIRGTRHPSLGRSYVECAYAPMVELLDYLGANGFTTYIVSGGGRDFMRPISRDMYGIPRERVIGSSSTFTYTSDGHHGTITHQPAADYVDDGPEKPVRIWNRTGRRPILAGGNSNGDVAMLEFTQHPDTPTLRLLVLHDDADREFAYTSGAEQALVRADKDDWTVASMKDDWTTVF